MKNIFKIFALIIGSFYANNSNAQCSITSSTGYTVTLDIEAIELITPPSCQWGYNYNVKISYDITFSGSNIPSNLYTLQAVLSCGPQDLFFSLPLSGGTGTVTSTSSPYRTQSDCQTATVASLNCTTIEVKIEGPGISSQTFDCNIVALPVELISFNATPVAKDVQLNWSTASELNNQYFSIEKSIDGINYTSIATIDGAGNSQSIKNYNYTDADALVNSNKNYYRIKQIDFNGEFSYSPIAFAQSNSTLNQSIIYPNPSTSNQFTIAFNGGTNNHKVNIYNANGVLVNHFESNESSIIADQLAKGYYTIEILDIATQTIERIKFIQK